MNSNLCKFVTKIILLKFSLKIVLWLPFSVLSGERKLPLLAIWWYDTIQYKQWDLREIFQLEMTTYLSITFCFLLCLPLSLPSGYLAFRLTSNQNFDLFIRLSLIDTFMLRLFKLNFLGTIFNKHTAFVLLYNGITNIPYLYLLNKCYQPWDCPSPVALSWWLWPRGRRTPGTGCVRSSGTWWGYPLPPPAPGPSSPSCSGQLRGELKVSVTRVI